MSEISLENEEGHPTPQWNDALEKVVKKEGEQSQALYLLHHMSYMWATKRNDYIQIPAIVLASVTGFLSATSSVLPPIAIGAMSLSVGVLNTINSYYKFSQRAESHRITSLMYLKAYKSIETELSLPIYQRVDASKLLNELRDTMSKIADISPAIPNNIINTYKKNSKDYNISQPIIANGLDPISIFRDTHEEKSRVQVSFVSNEVVKKTDKRVGEIPQDLFKKTPLPGKK
jgi:hypothetical protein